MAQRVSGFDRMDRELYQTPFSTTASVLQQIRLSGPVLEPACGTGKMCKVIEEMTGLPVVGSDIHDYGSPRQKHQADFLKMADALGCRCIFTNPPYGSLGRMAVKFIEHALHLMEAQKGQVVMLLRVDFDSARTRTHLFRDNPAFMHKIVLLDRIVWFEDDEAEANPSENHSVFVWDFMNRAAPTVIYAGGDQEKRSKKERAA